jgi:hypothetical protein
VRAEDCPHANVLFLFRSPEAPREQPGEESASTSLERLGRCRICLHRVKRVWRDGRWSRWQLDSTAPYDLPLALGVSNPLGLSASELEAIRDLQAGVHRIEADDPIWDGLVKAGLVDAVELALGRAQLTIRGSGYRTE